MATRLNILFNGSPDEGDVTFREVVGMGYERIPFSRFAKWRLANKSTNIWSLDIDVVPVDRPRVVYILVPDDAQNDDIETCQKEITQSISLPLRLFGEKDIAKEHRIEMKHSCVDVCDRVLVVNSNPTIDAETQSVIEYAVESGKRVAYLKY